MRKFLFLALLACITGLVFSSCNDEEYSTKSTLQGIVVEKDTSVPLADVIVTLGDNDCFTGEDGSFEFHNLVFNKAVVLHAEKTGYKAYDREIKPEEIRTTDNITIRLEKRP